MNHNNQIKWHRPQELADRLCRTLAEAYTIVKKYGCKMKIVDKEIWVDCEELLQRINPFSGQKK